MTKPAKPTASKLRLCIALCYAIPLLLLGVWGAGTIWLDPFNLYHWRASYQWLKPGLIHNVSYLFWNAAYDKPGAVWALGASNNIIFRPEHFQRAYGDVPVRNFSMNGITFGELSKLMDAMENAGQPSYVYLSLDLTFPSRETTLRKRFTDFLYNHSLWDDYRYWYSTEALTGSYYLLTSGKLWVRSSAYPEKQYRYRESGYRRFNSPENIAGIAAFIQQHPHLTFTPPKVDCTDYKTELDRVEQFVRTMQARGTKVDMLFPPYAYAVQSLRRDKAQAKFKKDFYEIQIGYERCFVERLSHYENARLFGFDDVQWITTDLANYYDPVHYHPDKVVNYLFDAIHDNTHRLTPGMMPAYEQRFLKGLNAYYDGIYKAPPVKGPKAVGWDLVY
ncbi:hypothetical protein GC177_04210 [bacterium]|nr:hypothetical protein [bacterium]